MRKFYTLMVSVWVLSLIFSEVIAQAPAPDWTKLYAGPTGKGGTARLIKVVNGYVYVAGSGGSIKGVAGVYVVKYDMATGNPATPFQVMNYQEASYPYDMEVDVSGNIYVASMSNASSSGNSVPNNDFLTIKFNANGTLAWARKYAGNRGAVDCAQALAVDNSGNVYVTGGAEGLNSTNASAAIVTLKYNSSGVLQWEARIDDYNSGDLAIAGGPYESAQDLAIDGNGDVYITGESNRQMIMAKYAGNYTGSGFNPVIWKTLIPEGTNGRSIGISNGNIIASGWDGAIVSYSTVGTRNWVKDYGASFWDMALSGSAIYATGSLGRDIFTAKYDLQGNEVWSRTFNRSTNTATGYAIAFDACDNVYITGRVSVQEGKNLVSKLPIIKYKESGNLDWETYNGVQGYDIATDPSGAIYVTGEQFVRSLQNFITAKYPSGCTPPQTVEPFSTMEETGLNSVTNYPNPFRSSTTISFRLAKAGHVSLNVFDLTGRRIQTLIQEQRNAGQHAVKFSSNNLPSGIYIYRLEADGYSKTGQMILEK